MNISTMLASASCAALLGLAACQSADTAATDVKSAAQAQTTPTLSTQDATFINTVSQANAGEIKMAQLALSTSHSKHVKAFASKMVNDHTAAQTQLASLAQSKQITPSTGTTMSDDQLYSTLQGEHGRVFNKTYLEDQIQDHQAAVQAFQTEIQSGTDPDVKAFATQTLTTIQMHLAMAQKLAGKG